jgi:hypothetical protein
MRLFRRAALRFALSHRLLLLAPPARGVPHGPELCDPLPILHLLFSGSRGVRLPRQRARPPGRYKVLADGFHRYRSSRDLHIRSLPRPFSAAASVFSTRPRVMAVAGARSAETGRLHRSPTASLLRSNGMADFPSRPAINHRRSSAPASETAWPSTTWGPRSAWRRVSILIAAISSARSRSFSREWIIKGIADIA